MIIATGARPRTLNVPGADLRDVHYLRSLDDSKSIRGSTENAKQAVVIGGGFIGMEVAVGANLFMANLTETKLHEVDLSGAHVVGANFMRADLRDSILRQAFFNGLVSREQTSATRIFLRRILEGPV